MPQPHCREDFTEEVVAGKFYAKKIKSTGGPALLLLANDLILILPRSLLFLLLLQYGNEAKEPPAYRRSTLTLPKGKNKG